MGIEVWHEYVDLSIADIFGVLKERFNYKNGSRPSDTLIDPTYLSHT